MRAWVLGSGSRGNAVLVESAGTRLLVDCGFSPRTLAGRLAAIGLSPRDVHAVVLTHEHQDHAKGAAAGAAQFGWQVFASEGTLRALGGLPGAAPFAPGATVAVGHAVVETVRVPHDAAQPVAVVVSDPATGARCGVALDLGHVPAAMLPMFRALDVLVLEANHDPDLLAAGPYPPAVRARIASKAGHLSNVDAARAIRAFAHRGLRHVVLAHLSETCNTPTLALTAVRSALEGSKFRGTVHAAPADGPIGPFSPVATRIGAPGQFELGLFA
ncbi:MAG: MBL fold metallo-hydrolase [Gemmatimonadaceae bacterium]|nr:MBL fold metallo-hydrolase [Gemmatimonadaceae bacterium]